MQVCSEKHTNHKEGNSASASAAFNREQHRHRHVFSSIRRVTVSSKKNLEETLAWRR